MNINVFLLLIIFFIGCSAKKPNVDLIGKTEICSGNEDICNYSNDISFFNNSLYVIGKKSDTIVVYNIKQKITSGVHIDKLPHQANQIFVNNDFIYISCDNNLYLYKHNGQFVKIITFPFEGGLNHFSVNKFGDLIGFWREKIFLLDKKGKLKKEQINPINSDVSYIDNGNNILGGNDDILFSYKTTTDSLVIQPVFKEKINKQSDDFYLGNFLQDQTMWYNYFLRDTLYVYNKNLTEINRKIPVGTVFKPSEAEIEFETGFPLFKIFPSGESLILVRSFKTSIAVYNVNLK